MSHEPLNLWDFAAPPEVVDDEIRDALEASTRAAADLALISNVPAAVASAIDSADIASLVGSAVTAADIPGAVNSAIDLSDIPGQIGTAVSAEAVARDVAIEAWARTHLGPLPFEPTPCTMATRPFVAKNDRLGIFVRDYGTLGAILLAKGGDNAARLSGGVDPVNAYLDLSVFANHAVKTVIEYGTPGPGGNAIVIAYAYDGVGSASFERVDGATFILHYVPDSTTVAQAEAAITLHAESFNLRVKTPASGPDATHVLSGSDAWTYSQHTDGGVSAVKASLDLATLGDGSLDGVVENIVAGVIGNETVIAIVGDSAPEGGASISVAGAIESVHFEDDVSTPATVAAALVGAGTLVSIKTAPILTAPLAAENFTPTVWSNMVGTNADGEG